jgi:hypothetical protein
MSDEIPKLRKRSEAGKAKPETFKVEGLNGFVAHTGEAAPEPPGTLIDGFPRGFAGAGRGADEDIAKFCATLRECGFVVTLVEAAKWGPEGRNVVRKWLTTRNMNNLPIVLASSKRVPDPAQNVLSDPAVDAPKVEPARLDAEKTAKPKTQLRGRASDPGVTVAHVDLENGKRTELHEASKALAEEVAKEEAGPPPKPPAPAVVSTEYEAFIETIMREVDLDQEFARLLPHLEVGEQRKDYAAVYDALDRAERRAFDANGLWINARMEYERLKLDQKEVDAVLYRQAMVALEKAEKKTRLADVDAEIATLFPDEWRNGKLRLKRAELATERVESFAKLWNSKVASLRSLLDNVRR